MGTKRKFDVEVTNETGDFYRFFNSTPHAAFLYSCVQKTIEVDLPAWGDCADRQEFYQLLTYNGDVDLESKLDQSERFQNFAGPHDTRNGQTPYEALRERLSKNHRYPVGLSKLHYWLSD